ncbi:hypothetical protein HRbin01_00161 [archaeon HR01]|nr:hypothetical protein HRbin01_00161 [archaeon HR01]
MMDSYYDSNKAIGIAMEMVYAPLVRPNTRRDRGYFRKKSRKVFGVLADNYRYRPRGSQRVRRQDEDQEIRYNSNQDNSQAHSTRSKKY